MTPPPVTRNPRLCDGRHFVAGTTVQVWWFVERWLGGDSIDDLAEDYELTTLQIENALRWWSQRTKPLRLRILRGKA